MVQEAVKGGMQEKWSLVSDTGGLLGPPEESATLRSGAEGAWSNWEVRHKNVLACIVWHEVGEDFERAGTPHFHVLLVAYGSKTDRFKGSGYTINHCRNILCWGHLPWSLLFRAGQVPHTFT